MSRVGPALAVVLAAAVAVAAVAAFTGSESGPPLTIFAAASLGDVLPRVDPTARYRLTGSNQVALQLRQGAPADVVASASPVHTQALFRDGLVERPRVFATNTLVLAVPYENPAGIRTVDDLARGPGLRLVAAAPNVPIGLYTREVLERLGLEHVLGRTVSREPDVKGIVGKLAVGEADAGFVYATDVAAAGGRIVAIPIPPRAGPSVRYEVAVVRSAPNRDTARRFVAALLGESGRRQLARAGFGLP